MTTENLLNEAAGYLELEDLQDAEAALNRLSPEESQTPDAKALWKALQMAKGNFAEAAELATLPELNQTPAQKLANSHCLSLAGNHRNAYEMTLASEEEGYPNPLYWFNRACYASLCGEFVDAVNSLGVCFIADTHLMTDCFLEPDLNAMWDYLESLDPSVNDSEFLLFPGWERAIRRWESRQDPMVVPVACKEIMPEPIRQFVGWQALNSTLRISPTAPHTTAQEFEAWKWRASEPKIEVLRGVLSKARIELLQHQAKFAFDQAQAGNFTAARFHLIFLFASIPNYPLAEIFAEGNFLEILLADIKSAMQEDALFCRKIEQARFAMEAADLEAAEDYLDSVLPEGRKTNLYALRLCHFEHFRGRNEVAAEMCQRLMKVWPFEISILKILLEEAMKREDWEVAEKLLAEAHPSFEDFTAFEFIQQSIKDRELHEYELPLFDFIGHRNLGGHLRPEAALRAQIGPFILHPKKEQATPSSNAAGHSGAQPTN